MTQKEDTLLVPKAQFLRISGRPANLHGSVLLPPSKSYLHRALFVAALCRGPSTIKVPGRFEDYSDDIRASLRVLSHFGVGVSCSKKTSDHHFLSIRPPENLESKGQEIFVGGSGTTARFAISFSALAKEGTITRITGDGSLSRRPMQPLVDALSWLGVNCFSSQDGRLPIVVSGGGIKGGSCLVRGSSISSQFVSSLLIACTKAKQKCEIRTKGAVVSQPYIDATLAVLRHYGFKVLADRSKSRFHVAGNQRGRAHSFKVPGDMSSACSLIAAAISSGGSITVRGLGELPQADDVFLKIARKSFGVGIKRKKNSLTVRANGDMARRKSLAVNLKDSPDLVPILAGLAAGVGTSLSVKGIGHLVFKESNRMKSIENALQKLGIRTKMGTQSLAVFPTMKNSKEYGGTVVDPSGDHRIFMALAIAALSGRFGEVVISDPSCVRKSYPNFVSDMQTLIHQSGLIALERGRWS